MRKFLLFFMFFILFFIFVSMLLLLTGYNPIAAVECHSSNGKYVASHPPTAALMDRYCLYEYSDGGKKCTSSDQCKGKCLVVSEDSVIRFDDSLPGGDYESGLGVCESSNRYTGCVQGTIEDPYSACY